MLVLTRKAGDSLIIDGGIRVRVLSQRGNKVRLGVEAPPGVAIWREELDAKVLSSAFFSRRIPNEIATSDSAQARQ